VSLRTGITTGTCAAAAARAAATVLAGLALPAEVPVELPDGRTVIVPVLRTILAATAAVRKDAGDDPDVTDGLEIVATVSWNDGDEVTLSAGEGVGTVTRPGLQVPPGQPAINPVPRRMIVAAVRQVTPRGLHVEIAIPGGREIAARTFNPRLGIVGGLSILGTTGIVRPYCTRALHDALRCAVDVAAACGQTAPVLVPGAIGARAARARFVLGDQQLIEVGNAWGFVLDLLPRHSWRALLLVGHPGKLAKLAAGQWDTHSGRSDPATKLLSGAGGQGSGAGEQQGSATTEGIFAALDERRRKELGDALAARIQQAVAGRLKAAWPVAVLLVDMSGRALGCDGDLLPWQ
jgi:cobalt-precorrin-5B (C1)-methyltransferase